MDLEGWSLRLKVFADATRVRLLALLEREELTVAELSAITRLAQPVERRERHLHVIAHAGDINDDAAWVLLDQRPTKLRDHRSELAGPHRRSRRPRAFALGRGRRRC